MTTKIETARTDWSRAQAKYAEETTAANAAYEDDSATVGVDAAYIKWNGTYAEARDRFNFAANAYYWAIDYYTAIEQA